MARRVSWTNNSSGHDGTTIHRSTTAMDPQALPAAIGTVAAGTTEYIDSEALPDGTYYYRVQDYQGASVSAASAEQSFTISTAPDYSTAQIGDPIGGGIYAGTITYADARQYHIVAAKAAGEAYGLQWGNVGTLTTATDVDDGMANQNVILTSFDSGDSDAFYYCRDYTGGGHSDWYMPSKNEMLLIINNLVVASHPEFSVGTPQWRHVSRDHSTLNSNIGAWGAATVYDNGLDKGSTDVYVRPIRRVAV